MPYFGDGSIQQRLSGYKVEAASRVLLPQREIDFHILAYVLAQREEEANKCRQLFIHTALNSPLQT